MWVLTEDVYWATLRKQSSCAGDGCCYSSIHSEWYRVVLPVAGVQFTFWFFEERSLRMVVQLFHYFKRKQLQ
jgi:hypothetical protein